MCLWSRALRSVLIGHVPLHVIYNIMKYAFNEIEEGCSWHFLFLEAPPPFWWSGGPCFVFTFLPDRAILEHFYRHVLRQRNIKYKRSQLQRSKMAQIDHAAALAELRSQQQKHPLSILKLAEPIVASTQNTVSPSKRGSNVSNSEIENPTPASLEADLLHYKVRLSNSTRGKLCLRVCNSVDAF